MWSLTPLKVLLWPPLPTTKEMLMRRTRIGV